MLTNAERKEYRTALLELEKLVNVLDSNIIRGSEIDPRTELILNRMTETSEKPNQLLALRTLYKTIDEQYDERLRYDAQFRLSPFCEYMFRHEPPALHHEFLIDHMEAVHNGDIMRLAISMPPGSAKSSYASIRFAAWHLGRRPNDRWLQGAHTQMFAKDRLGKPVRQLIADTRYKEVFPEMGISSSSGAADYFEFTGGSGYYKAVGVGVAIAGYRFEIGGIDDPISSREDAESPTVRRKLHEWYEDDFGTRPSNPRAPIFIATTRWHEDDLVGHEINKMAEGIGDYPWEIINIPAIAEQDDPLGREEGEGLWPEVFGLDFYLMKKRGMTGRSWNSLYMGAPTDEEGGVLKREDVHRYKNIPEDQKRADGTIIKKIVKSITLSVDCAEKATQRSDYTAAMVWLETNDKKHYLIHAARIRKEFNEMVEWIENLAKEFNVDKILCEDRGAGTQYIQVKKDKPGNAPVIPINTQQKSKEFRFDGVTPMFSSGLVFLPESGTDWIADVEADLFAFPNGRNDDYVDTTSQYLQYTRGNRAQRGVKKINTAYR